MPFVSLVAEFALIQTRMLQRPVHFPEIILLGLLCENNSSIKYRIAHDGCLRAKKKINEHFEGINTSNY